MTEALLWCGMLVFAGAAASVLLRRAGIPMLAAALAGGFALSFIAGGALEPSGPDPLGLIRSILLAMLCFLLGSELDLGQVVRSGRRVALTAIASSLAAMLLVWGAAILAGFGRIPAAVLAAAAGGASPAAVGALTSELRARGESIQRALLAAPVGLLTSIVAIGVALSRREYIGEWIATIGIGALAGLVILIPVSRLATRGAIVACAGAGSVILAGAGSLILDGDAGVVLSAVVAGFIAGNLSRNREAVRDSLRDLSLPLTVCLFALTGSTFSIVDGPVILGSILVTAARGAAVVGVGLALGRDDGIVPATSSIPIALIAPGLIASASSLDSRLLPVLAGAVLLTQVAGSIAARRMMIRSGAASPAGDPDAWREAMR